MNITEQVRRDPRTGRERTLYLVHDEGGKHYGTYRDKDRAIWRVYQVVNSRKPKKPKKAKP